VAEETEREPAEEISGAGKRVLIVDDNVDTARLTGRLLKSLGYEVRLCHDGGEAIEAAREFRPEVVLLDIGLPGLNGFEVARQLREEACCLDSLIIGISGYGDHQARERARESGFDHHLVKPVDIEAVTKLVSRPRRP
jgi:CheY-like chemotaxis protein